MLIFHNANELKRHLAKEVVSSSSVGFVPTMGALHKGHLSLIEHSKQRCDFTICSIFVNPTQFDNPEDLVNYPVHHDKDVALLQSNGCDMLYLPEVTDVYPNGTALNKDYPLGRVEELLEGAHRKGHFQGVAQVVHRLLDIVCPDFLFLGQKDFQQCAVLEKLVRDILQLKTEVVRCPIIREPDGLAMSSRNARLSVEERNDAVVLYNALIWATQHTLSNSAEALIEQVRSDISAASTVDSIDYVSIIDPDTLEATSNLDHALMVLAVHFPSARLIDNISLR